MLDEIMNANFLEMKILRDFWLKLHQTDDHLVNKLLKEHYLLRIDRQLFFLKKNVYEKLSFRESKIFGQCQDFRIVHAGTFIGFLTDDTLFSPSLGFLHFIDPIRCRKILIPRSLVGVFTKGRTLKVTPSLKFRNCENDLKKSLDRYIFVVKWKDFVLGLGNVFVNEQGHLSLCPILHVGQYLSSEDVYFSQ